MEYAAYRDKHFSLSCEERKGRAMNMQEFIWSKIPRSSGPYQYDLDDPRGMKMKDIFERHKLSCIQFKEQNEKEIITDNNQEATDEISITSSDKSLDESDPKLLMIIQPSILMNCQPHLLKILTVTMLYPNR